MNVLVFGQSGQLAQSIQHTQPRHIKVQYLSSQDCDVRQPEQIKHHLEQNNWDLVINCSAYTQVDLAEKEHEQAVLLNTNAPKIMAQLCLEANTRFIHISTDFVFNGQQSRPYDVHATTSPQSVYGQTKAGGEQAVLAQNPDSLIIRTAWVYAEYGNNFVKTMLQLMQQKSELGVIADQVGSPTWARGLAEFIWQLAQQQAPSNGILHWTDAGIASWYDFAVAIQEEALALGLLDYAIPVNPLTTEQYPTPAPRPAYSVLDKTQSWQLELLEVKHWRQQLRLMLQKLNQLQSN